MKKLFTIVIALYSSIAVFAQCTPDQSVTTPGLYPPDSLLPCIVSGQAYDTVIQFKNFTTVNPADFGITTPIPITITVNWIKIDTILNAPSGISYECNNDSCYYSSGQNGCLRVSGLTNDPRGNYPLDIVATISVSIPFFGDTVITISSAEAQQNGFGAGLFSYTLQVIEPGDPCPYPTVSVAPSTALLCEGSSTILQPSIRFGTPPFSYTWSPSTGLNDVNAESPTAQLVNGDITYTVTVVDDNGTEFSNSYDLILNKLPIADFTFTVTGNTVSFESTSQFAQGYRWEFGDGTNAVGPVSTHTYLATSLTDFEVALIAQNDCDNDTTYKTITVTSIAEKNFNNFAVNVLPNPNNGTFNIAFNNVELNGKELNVRLFNVNGEVVYTEKVLVNNAVFNKSLNLNMISKGIYFLHLNTEKLQSINKISIIH
jgi:hypothetical protein